MTVSSEMETELKYEAAELPSLRDLPGVRGVDGPRAERLDAIYFDTADLRLARHCAGRTGGEDAGWHLKVPAGASSRTELRLPLGGWCFASLTMWACRCACWGDRFGRMVG